MRRKAVVVAGPQPIVRLGRRLTEPLPQRQSLQIMLVMVQKGHATPHTQSNFN